MGKFRSGLLILLADLTVPRTCGTIELSNRGGWTVGVGNRFPRKLNGADRYYPIPNAKTMQNPEKPGAKLLIYMAIFPSFSVP